MAAEYSSQKVLSVAFRKWVSRTELRAHSRSEMERAAEHSAVKLEGTVWKAWRMVCLRSLCAAWSVDVGVVAACGQEEGKSCLQDVRG